MLVRGVRMAMHLYPFPGLNHAAESIIVMLAMIQLAAAHEPV